MSLLLRHDRRVVCSYTYPPCNSPSVGYFVSPDYGSTRVRDPTIPVANEDQVPGVAPPQANTDIHIRYEAPPSYESVRHIYEIGQPYQQAAAANYGFVADNPPQSTTQQVPTAEFSDRVTSAQPQQIIPDNASGSVDTGTPSAGNPFLSESVPEGVLIDIEVQPAPAFGSVDTTTQGQAQQQEDLMRFEPDATHQQNGVDDLLSGDHDMANVPPPAFGSVE